MTILAATYSNTQSLWPYQLLGFAAIAALIVVPILVWRSYRKSSEDHDAASGIFAGTTPPRVPEVVSPGEVQITFHTYTGLLVYFVQRKYTVILPADQAKLVLGRMLKHNCTRGMLSPGCIYIPVLSYFEYRSQMKKVAAGQSR